MSNELKTLKLKDPLGLEAAGYLVLPVSRFPRYILFMKELVKLYETTADRNDIAKLEVRHNQ